MMKKSILFLSVLLMGVASLLAARKSPYYYIDISPCANESFGNGSMPLNNLKVSEKPMAFGGMNFKLISSGSNDGKNAIFTPANERKTINLKLKGNKFTYKYLYILHTTSGKPDAKGNIGGIELSGRKSIQNHWLKREEMAGDFSKKNMLENAISVFSSDNAKGEGNLYLSAFPLHMSDPVSNIKIETYAKVDWKIVAMTLTDKMVSTGVSYIITPEEWRPVESCREIVEGSALDMSNLMTEKPAGKYGRLIVNKDGKFEFKKNRGVRVKFKGTNDRPGNYFGKSLKTHEDIDKMVKQYRKQGYNMLRWRISMYGYEFEAPYKLKKEVQDLYDYFIFALAREGIYSHWNLSSHDLGDPNFKWSDRFDVKCKFIFGDPKTREDWRQLMIMQLNHVNPYTGKAWKDDPSIATTEYFNELDTLYPFHSGMSAEGRDFGDKVFVKWIEKRYKTIDALNAEWKPKKPFKSFSEVRPFNNDNLRRLCLRDISQFVIDYSRDMQQFCEKVIREEIGFTAPVHQHNCVIRGDVYLLSAEAGTYMANNVYFCHPTAFMSAGSRVAQYSSLSEGYAGTYWLHAANKKMADRPYCVTEYQHSHWNQWKHEAGVFFPAYSAFQDFDNLTIHDQAVSANPPRTLSCFEVADSPVYRANEFLSCMLYFRGDVSPAKKRVDVVYDKNYVENDHNMMKGMNHEQSKIAYMTGFAIDFPSARKIDDLKNVVRKPADLQMKPQGSARVVWANSIGPAKYEKDQFDIAQTAIDLKIAGILPENNISDPANGIYQTDTGEITTNFKEGWVKVKTPKTEALVWKVGMKPTKIRRLNVISSSEPAAIALTSIDDNPLRKSKRMVLVYNTDNTSSGVELSLDKKTLKNYGKLPVLVKTGKLSVEIKLPKKGFIEGFVSEKQYNVYALKMNGERIEQLAPIVEGGVMKLEIDTAKLGKEPALYYEIVEE